MTEDLSKVAQLDERTANLHGSLGRGESEAWGAGKAFEEISTAKLYLARHATLREYFDREIQPHHPGLKFSTLSNYSTVARVFPQASAAAYSVSVLQALIHYANARHLGPLPADPGGLPIPVGGKDKLLRDCSVQDLKKATASLKSRPPQSLPLGVTAALMMMRSGAKALNIPVRIDARVSPKGEVLIDLRDVPWKSLAGLVGAMSKVLPPSTSAMYVSEDVVPRKLATKKRAAGKR